MTREGTDEPHLLTRWKAVSLSLLQRKTYSGLALTASGQSYPDAAYRRTNG
jgi:hypothetical protein